MAPITVTTTSYVDRNTVVAGNPLDIPGFSLIMDDQFTGGALDTTRWFPYNNSTFGATTRIQRYMDYNVVVGTGSPGATGGTSCKLLSVREDVGGNAFTAGMLDTKSAGWYLPRYCRVEWRAKWPHGQGLWPAAWLTARIGGANVAEMDSGEYFHTEVPAKLRSTLHRADSTGLLKTNVSKASVFFEAPTYTPGWHTLTQEIYPPAGADLTAPSQQVQFKTYIDGVLAWSYLDTDALYWSTNGGSEDAFWNVYLQGCQIDGNYIGHPDDPLGYSHWLNKCIVSGTAPNACATTVGGYSVIRAGAPGATATFGDPATTFEVDYQRVWKYTG